MLRTCCTTGYKRGVRDGRQHIIARMNKPCPIVPQHWDLCNAASQLMREVRQATRERGKCRDAGAHLQRDGRVALALVLGALDEAPRMALQRDGAAVEQLRPDPVQLRHLARPQEDLRIIAEVIKCCWYASGAFAAEEQDAAQHILMLRLTRMHNMPGTTCCHPACNACTSVTVSV